MVGTVIYLLLMALTDGGSSEWGKRKKKMVLFAYLYLGKNPLLSLKIVLLGYFADF